MCNHPLYTEVLQKKLGIIVKNSCHSNPVPLLKQWAITAWEYKE